MSFFANSLSCHWLAQISHKKYKKNKMCHFVLSGKAPSWSNTAVMCVSLHYIPEASPCVHKYVRSPLLPDIAIFWTIETIKTFTQKSHQKPSGGAQRQRRNDLKQVSSLVLPSFRSLPFFSFFPTSYQCCMQYKGNGKRGKLNVGGGGGGTLRLKDYYKLWLRV